jgi:prolyl oligopeptidase
MRLRFAVLVSPFLSTVAAACAASPPPTRAAAPVASASPAASASSPRDPALTPPTTRRDDFHEILHGVALTDPYRWLEDDASPETRAWIDAQNTYSHALIEPIAKRAQIRSRLDELARVDRQSLPRKHGKRYFTWKRRAEDELWTFHVRDGLDARDEVLLDPHPLSPDHTTSLDVDSIADNGRRLVYSVRRGGEDETELRVFDVDARKDLPEALPRALYRGVSMTPDGSGFYYTVHDRTNGPRVRFHAIGTPFDRDRIVFGEGLGPSDGAGVGVTNDGRHLIAVAWHGWAKTDLYVQDLTKKGTALTPLVVGQDARSDVGFAGDRAIMLTNLDAPNGRVVEVDPRHPEPSKWRTIVPEGKDTIEDFWLIGGRVVVKFLHDVVSRIVVVALDGKVEGGLALPTLGEVPGISGRWEEDELFLGFTSYTTPAMALRANVRTREMTTWWTPKVPVDTSAFETEQVWVTSKDGTRVPMFVVHKKGIEQDGARPTLLYGYGGFNVSETPYFSSSIVWWIEQGGVYAVPNLRGGGEYGEKWHRAGMLDKKQNVFDDFIAAAEWLVANKYTSPARLAIRGGSNGGLLVGAALTQRPELFRAVLCEYPDLDMIGYHRFKNNNKPALLEYGDASKPDEFKFLLAYSPYQKVTDGTRYPAVLLVTGDEDTRVPPLQARKMTARLQSASTSGRPIALLYDAKAGHSGGKPLGKALDDEARSIAFLDWQLAAP